MAERISQNSHLGFEGQQRAGHQRGRAHRNGVKRAIHHDVTRQPRLRFDALLFDSEVAAQLQQFLGQEKALGTEIAQIPVVPFGADHAARPRARLEDLRGDSGRAQRAGTRQTGNAAADHQD